MDESILSPASENLAKNNFIKFLSGILVLLMTFNLSWLFILVRIYSSITTIKNLNKTFLNLELLLILGNLCLLLLFFGYVFFRKSLRNILGK